MTNFTFFFFKKKHHFQCYAGKMGGEGEVAEGSVFEKNDDSFKWSVVVRMMGLGRWA